MTTPTTITPADVGRASRNLARDAGEGRSMSARKVQKGEAVIRAPKGQDAHASPSSLSEAMILLPQGQELDASDPIATIRAHCRALVESGADADSIEAAVVSEMDGLIAHYMRPENTEARLAVLRHLARAMAITIKGQSICGNRARSWTAPNYTKGGNGDRLVALADYQMLHFRLPNNGPRLCDATSEQVREAAAFYAADAADAAHKSRWLTAVADHLDSGQKLTEQRVRALKESTK